MKNAPNEGLSAEGIDEFADAYFKAYNDAVSAIDRNALAAAARILWNAFIGDRFVFVCGNGGSAGISNHFTCDFIKRQNTKHPLRSRIVSLASGTETMTMISNDYGYEEVFRYQLQSLARPGEVLVTISSSGNSENIVRAIEWAKENGLSTIALTGFSGGRSAALADVNIHVASNNYGTVEDAHQSVMHLLSQYLHRASVKGEGA